MADAFTITVDDAQLLGWLRRLGPGLIDVAARALYEEAEAIMAVSKAEYVPVDHGQLRASGHVQPPVIEGSTIDVELGYGGAASEYAVAVHEHLSEHSPPTWVRAEAEGQGINWTKPGTGPKYLEIPVAHAMEGMDARLAARIAELMQDGLGVS